MRTVAILGCFALASLSCSDEGEAPSSASYDCEAPARIVILKRDEIRSTCFDEAGNACDLVGIALPNGVTTRLNVAVYDDDKRECDPAMTTASADGDAFDVVNDGIDVYVTPLADVFDTENKVEPSATLTVRHGGLTARWRMMAMIDLAAVWEISIDGLVVGDFEASQSGRFIRWAECEPNDSRPECSAGLVFRNQASLQSPIGSLLLQGVVRPDRDMIDGKWTNGPQHGVWTARRVTDE